MNTPPTQRLALAIAMSIASSAHAIEVHDTAHDTPVTLNALQVIATPRSAATAPTQVVGPNRYIINATDLDAMVTGNNGLAMLKQVPGASYTATDGLGLDISATSLFVRGFRMNEMGITFEGVPLNDSGFLSLTGTSVVNVGVPDAIGAITVSPGGAPVHVFSSSANGGSLEYRLRDLQDSPSLRVKQGVGSNRTFVTTVSAQSGQLGEHGPKVLVDLQRVSADKYQGAGTQDFLRGNLKAQQDVAWGDITLFVSDSKAKVWGYNNMSFDMIRKLGWKADSFYPDYAWAYYVASPENAEKSCGTYTCGELSELIPYDTGQVTRDRVASINHRFQITPTLSGNVQLYNANSHTQATLTDPTVPSPNGAPFSEQVQTPRVNRLGGMANLQLEAGAHTFTAGVWQEKSKAAARTDWYQQPLLGQGAPLKATGPFDVYGPAFQTDNASRWVTRSQQFYLHDDIALSDTLKLGVGFKAVDFRTEGGGLGDAPDRPVNGALRAKDNFLPHASLFWSPNASTDAFIDLASGMNGYRVAQRGNIGYTASAWTVTDQEEFDRIADSLRPEKNWNLTVGATHRFDRLTLTGDVFYSDIRNRLLSAAVGTQFAQINTVRLMPKMHVIGADLGITADLGDHLQFYQGVAVARSYYDSDFVVGDTVYPIKGNAQPGYPQVSLVSDLSAHFGDWRVGATSTSYLRQPFTYQNDIRVPTFWQVNTYAAYTLGQGSVLPGLELRLDISNLFNRNNIGTATIAGSSFSGDYQTLQRSAPRQVMFSTAIAF
ncbi:TonB-dependent receptor [Stenotrophomonas sp. ZAC14D2_NAIMI4_7]|uniref:TonB-dependent receptor n=1 Tax=Stenotrophomonas sp. ZAC14D2_NAIMI4_7 TaxID=2072405 RepID=UPI000D53F822|nr:TonB-dependent receptor [Stenotrophomonas sp. ZAC14D2_NAIMI4_7]AWH19248.1 TonB-dependent receptor [Stenotrophomonas sp. ZAC14D2_NAIMI4_7]